MQTKQHVGLWLLLAIMAFFAGPLMRSGPSMEEFVRSEIRDTRIAMGDTIGGLVVEFADGLFRQTPVAVVTRQLSRAKHNEAERRLSREIGGPAGEAVSKLYNSYMQGLIMQAYVLTMRLAVVGVWLAFLLPMFVATVFDGLMQRAVKQAEFGSLRPATFTLAGLLVIPVLSLPVLYLTMPFPLSPLLAPAWAAFVALPLSVLISNSQPLFGR